ncbi:MAG: tetratricopeptide repeat protein [Rubrobacteraceae bacterium]
MSLARGLDGDPSLRCALLVDYAASTPVRKDLPRDLRRLAQGRTDRLKPIATEFLERLKAEGIEPGRSFFARLSVIVADVGDSSQGEGTALVLLSMVVDRSRTLTAWTAFREDGMRLAETAGRRDAPSLWELLEDHGIRSLDIEEPPLSQREDHVPPYPQPFVGRETLVEEIRELLYNTGDVDSTVVVVQGLPGSGKTAVAAAVADGLRSHFSGKILWAPVGPNPNLLSVLADLGRTLGSADLSGYTNVGAASARMKALLRDQKVMIVLDDVWEAEHVRPLAVGGPESAMLATTRSRQAARSMAPSGTMLEIGPLSEAEAVSLLEELVPSLDEADHGRLSELGTKLGCLPLALKVAGRLLEEEATLGLGVADLLSEIKEGEKLLAAYVPPDLVDLVETTTPTVTALLGRSTDALEDNERERFGRLGVFEPGPASFDLSAVGAVWGETDEQDTRSTLNTLVGRGLVDPDGSGRFSLHPVLKMQASSLLGRASDDGLMTHYLHTKHYLELLRSANALYRSGGEARKVGLALFDTEWENVRAGQHFAASRLAEDSEDAEAARLVSGYADVGWELLSLRASLDERTRWLEKALDGDRLLIEANSLSGETDEGQDEILRNYRSAQASHLHMLAMVRYHAGRTDDAFALERESCEIWRSLGDRRGESRTLNILGALHAISGDYPLAEQSYLKAIELLDEEADDPEATAHPPKSHDRDRAAILGNLTNLYRRRCKAALANEASNEAIAIFRALGDMIQVGIALNNRGAIRSELEDDIPGAVKAFSTSRRIFRYLGSRSDEAHSLLALGREDVDAGDYQPAENKAKEVIAVCEELGTHSQKGSALFVLGEARLGLGYPDEAEGFYQEALDIAHGAQDTRLEADAREGLEKVARARENT